MRQHPTLTSDACTVPSGIERWKPPQLHACRRQCRGFVECCHLTPSILNGVLKYEAAGWHGVDVLVGTECRCARDHPAYPIPQIVVVGGSEEGFQIGCRRHGKQLDNAWAIPGASGVVACTTQFCMNVACA